MRAYSTLAASMRGTLSPERRIYSALPTPTCSESGPGTAYFTHAKKKSFRGNTRSERCAAHLFCESLCFSRSLSACVCVCVCERAAESGRRPKRLSVATEILGCRMTESQRLTARGIGVDGPRMGRQSVCGCQLRQDPHEERLRVWLCAAFAFRDWPKTVFRRRPASVILEKKSSTHDRER